MGAAMPADGGSLSPSYRLIPTSGRSGIDQSRSRSRSQRIPVPEPAPEPAIPGPGMEDDISDAGEPEPEWAIPVLVPQQVPPAWTPLSGIMRAGPAHELGSMNVICEHCGAPHWIDETSTRSPVSSARLVRVLPPSQTPRDHSFKHITRRLMICQWTNLIFGQRAAGLVRLQAASQGCERPGGHGTLWHILRELRKLDYVARLMAQLASLIMARNVSTAERAVTIASRSSSRL